MQITPKALLTIFLFLPIVTIYASEDQHSHDEESMFEEHSAHEHGHASSQITFINHTLNLALSLPSIDIFGFEHEPHNEKEHEIITQSQAILKNADNIISIHPNNECELKSISLESSIIDSVNENDKDHNDHESDEHHDAESHDEEEHNDEEHSDVSLHYVYSCSQDNLESIEYKIFDHFPTIEEIEVQFVSNETQNLFTATPKSRALSFK
ncbi:MAG: DUF2796 domain-containing protein [Gammaproteobacteria bacterium]|nr:MAG: DUF2796 domain-containing protein [Gammaproteobacteria bacterium]